MSYVAPRLHLLQTAVTTLKNLGVSGVSVSDSRQINIPASTTLKALSIVMFPSSKMKKISQIIENRYIDEDKLLDVCMHKFGLGNYRLRFKFNRWYLEAPSPLDEDALDQCEIEF